MTDAMKQYAIEKLSKIDRFTDRVVDVHVTMDVQKTNCIVEVTLKVLQTKIVAKSVNVDMYAAIDDASDKIKHQLQKYLSRLHDHHARNHEVRQMKVSILRPLSDDLLAEINEEIEEESAKKALSAFKPHKVIREESRPLKILTVDEAVMKMDLSGDAFLIFRAEHDMRLHVIYRRDDGHFGVIHLEA